MTPGQDPFVVDVNVPSLMDLRRAAGGVPGFLLFLLAEVSMFTASP